MIYIVDNATIYACRASRWVMGRKATICALSTLFQHSRSNTILTSNTIPTSKLLQQFSHHQHINTTSNIIQASNIILYPSLHCQHIIPTSRLQVERQEVSLWWIFSQKSFLFHLSSCALPFLKGLTRNIL